MSGIDRYQRPELVDSLASEYVLGTLKGRARRRFRSLIEERAYIRQAVEDWERRLSPLDTHVVPVQPPARVWSNIKRELDVQPRAQGRTTSWWSDLTFWRSAAFASLLAVAVLGVFRFAPAEYPSGMPYYMAVLENQQQTPMIVATAEDHPQRLKVMMMHAPDIDPDQDWELWAIPWEGGKPMSLGLLARNKETMLMLGEDCWKMMKEAQYLAVSSEPLGGSTADGPSGPVMYKGQLVTFI